MPGTVAVQLALGNIIPERMKSLVKPKLCVVPWTINRKFVLLTNITAFYVMYH